MMMIGTKTGTKTKTLALAAMAIFTMGCPPADQNKSSPSSSSSSSSSPTVCTKVGQSCEFSPGKLGTCVQQDRCPSGNASCFVCQSQH